MKQVAVNTGYTEVLEGAGERLPHLSGEIAIRIVWETVILAALMFTGSRGGIVATTLGLFALLGASAHPNAPGEFLSGQYAAPVGYQNADVALWFSAFWPAVALGSRRELPVPARGALLGATPHKLLHLSSRPVLVVPAPAPATVPMAAPLPPPASAPMSAPAAAPPPIFSTLLLVWLLPLKLRAVLLQLIPPTEVSLSVSNPGAWMRPLSLARVTLPVTRSPAWAIVCPFTTTSLAKVPCQL